MSISLYAIGEMPIATAIATQSKKTPPGRQTLTEADATAVAEPPEGQVLAKADVTAVAELPEGQALAKADLATAPEPR